MKHLLIACLALLCSATSWAESIKFIKAEAGQEWRSITFEPTASIDGNLIIIYSDITVQNVQVAVKDMAGNVVYTSTITIPAKQHHSFTLDNVESGDYVLEVTYADKFFYGYFIIE